MTESPTSPPGAINAREGSASFQLVNDGHSSHDLVILRSDGSLAAGSYRFI